MTIILTLGSTAPVLKTVQQWETLWMKAHQIVSLLLQFPGVRSDFPPKKCVCIEKRKGISHSNDNSVLKHKIKLGVKYPMIYKYEKGCN